MIRGANFPPISCSDQFLLLSFNKSVSLGAGDIHCRTQCVTWAPRESPVGPTVQEMKGCLPPCWIGYPSSAPGPEARATRGLRTLPYRPETRLSDESGPRAGETRSLLLAVSLLEFPVGLKRPLLDRWGHHQRGAGVGQGAGPLFLGPCDSSPNSIHFRKPSGEPGGRAHSMQSSELSRALPPSFWSSALSVRLRSPRR